MPTNAPLDQSALERLRRLGGEEFLDELIRIFLDFVPKKISQAVAGQQADHLLDVEQGAHAIKSSASHIGARRLEQLAIQIERLAKERRSEPLPKLLADLESEFARVKTALIKEQQNFSTSPPKT
jgi:HPt (histidine-containing phosphotransfer) domain-containing protein